MKTDALIAMLARGETRVAPHAVDRRIAATVAAAIVLTLLVVLGALGPRADFAAAAQLPMFWWKVAVPIAVGTLSFAAARRLASPGGRAGAAAVVGAILLAVLWLVAGADLASTPAPSRPARLLGHSALPCVVLIALLSLPTLAALAVALRSLAPTRLRTAGAAAGAVAGGIAASAYALHCDEMALPFVAAWYVLGMTIPAVLGALLAPRWLRWS